MKSSTPWEYERTIEVGKRCYALWSFPHREGYQAFTLQNFTPSGHLQPTPPQNNGHYDSLYSLANRLQIPLETLTGETASRWHHWEYIELSAPLACYYERYNLDSYLEVPNCHCDRIYTAYRGIPYCLQINAAGEIQVELFTVVHKQQDKIKAIPRGDWAPLKRTVAGIVSKHATPRDYRAAMDSAIDSILGVNQRILWI